jgi:hypothetical protein
VNVRNSKGKIYRADRSLPAILLCAVFVAVSIASVAQAQDEPAPPPIKMLSKTERQQLKGQVKPKDRTNLALDLMDTRIRSAEKFAADENYSLMYAELGGFEALMDNALNFLLKSSVSEGKQLDNLKRLDIGLRKFIPRIETIRRDLPVSFDPYLRTVLKDLSQTREKAIQPFFSDSVVSDH